MPVYSSDFLGIVAGIVPRPALLPQLFPIPHSRRHLSRQRESQRMRQDAHLPAMVSFVRNHVAQHLRANRPGLSAAISHNLLYTASTAAERFSEHLRAASGALGQCRTGLLRRAVRAVELGWNLQVRSSKPDPFAADIVRVREDRSNGADLAGRFGRRNGWQFGWRFRIPDGRSRCSIRSWFMRSLAAKIWTAVWCSCVTAFWVRLITAPCSLALNASVPTPAVGPTAIGGQCPDSR